MHDADDFIEDCDIVGGQTLVEIVDKITNLLYDANRWCGGCQAIDSNRRMVRVDSPHAVAWSIEGAAGKVSNNLGVIPPSVLRFLDGVLLKYDESVETLSYFNDTVIHGVLMEFLQLAREEAVRVLEQRK